MNLIESINNITFTTLFWFDLLEILKNNLVTINGNVPKFNFELYHTIEFDSQLINEKGLGLLDMLKNQKMFRLLETTEYPQVPIREHLRILTTSRDVIHSWAVPSLGIKMDALSGRLNQVSIFIKREGLYYGQCSEICGTHHGFMPIVIWAIKEII